MAGDWKQYVGQTVAEEFPLKTLLGTSEHCAEFLTDWRGRNPQPAVIKLVRSDSPDAERLGKSWQLAAKVSHPNLIRLFRTGICEVGGSSHLYGVMEYAEENLAQVISQRALEEGEARDMLEPAAGGLACLHAKGLVHSRVTPTHILAHGDRLKLSSDTLERADEPIRNPGPYDPPEKTTSPAADMWSLGMTLVEALTRRLPTGDPETRSDPALPASLSGVLLDVAGNCLRRDPKRRWTAAQVLERLNPPAAARQPLPSKAVRSSYLVPVGVVITLALIALAGFGLLSHHSSATHSESPAVTTTAEASGAKAAPSEEAASSPVSIPAANQPANRREPPPKVEESPGEAPVSSALATASSPAAPKTLEPVSADVSGSPVVRKVLPDAPQKALDTIHGTVRVTISVSVDHSGNVSDATITSPGPSAYFANLALKAARQWTFAPDRAASSGWTIRFEFTPSGAEAFTTRAAP